MSSELKPCPFCGCKEISVYETSLIGRDLKLCTYCGGGADDNEWNSRPIEDALKEQIAKIQEDNRHLVEQMNAMALQPNQEVITWHRWPEERPEMSDGEPVEVLCSCGDLLWFATYDHASEKLWCENESWEPHVALYWAYLPRGVK